MTKVFCDHCGTAIDNWQVSIIKTKWKDGTDNELGEICDICLEELKTWLRIPKKKVEEYV